MSIEQELQEWSDGGGPCCNEGREIADLMARAKAELDRLQAENADLLFAFRVQLGAVTPKTDDEIAAVARVFEKARVT